jgi:DHA1 family multidrug resistance protein-like MFS transporter
MPDRKSTIFLLVSSAIFMDMMAYTLVIPVLPSYSLSLGADTVTIGIIFGAYSVALLFCSIPFGMLSDMLGRRRIMILGMLSLAATNVIFAFSSSVHILILARLLQGMSAAATWSAGLAMLADAFGREERGRRLGMAMSAMSAGTLFGPAIGGILYESIGYAPTFVIPSALACAVGLLFIMVDEPHRRMLRVPLRERLEPFLKVPATSLAISLAVLAGAATYGILEPYMPVYMYGAFSATPTIVGLAFGAMSLLSVISQPLAGRLYDLHGGRSLIAAGFIFSALIIACSVSMPSLLLTALVFSLLGVTMCFALTPMLPLMSDLFNAGGSRGLVYGIYNTIFSLGLALGPLAGGLLIAGFTFRLTVLGYAVLLLATGVGAYLSIRQPKCA